MPLPPTSQHWEQLYEIASTQEGHFLAKQARDAGVSPQLLNHYLRSGRVVRVDRGIYRLVQFPPGEHEELMVVWLWSNAQGVFSHETALTLHELSDAMPAKIHITLPSSTSTNRRHVPRDVSVHFADVPVTDRTWVAAVPATTARRTLVDCANTNVAPDLLSQAAEQAVGRGLISRSDLAEVERVLHPFVEVLP